MHIALRARDPDNLGFFYCDLFGGRFFLHPVMTGVGITIVRFSRPDAFFQGIIEFWPWGTEWDSQAGVFRSNACEPGRTSVAHLAIGVEDDVQEVRDELDRKGIAYELEARAPELGLFIVSVRDPEGNQIEIFPAIEDIPIPESSLCAPEQAAERIAILRRRYASRYCNLPPEPGFARMT